MTTQQITPELERVARAIFDEFNAQGCSDDLYEWSNPMSGRDTWIALARAALQALLPVGEGMFAAIGYRGLNRTRDTAVHAEYAFTAAIQHVLGEGNDGRP